LKITFLWEISKSKMCDAVILCKAFLIFKKIGNVEEFLAKSGRRTALLDAPVSPHTKTAVDLDFFSGNLTRWATTEQGAEHMKPTNVAERPFAFLSLFLFKNPVFPALSCCI
jgi:hypothetical protein